MATQRQKNTIEKAPESEELNPRWAKFIELYVNSGNAYQSAIEVGFSEEYAKVITSRFPDKVRNSLKIALEHKGITSDKIAEKIEILLNASTPIYKNNNESGEIELVGEKPDYQAIDKGISHAIKVRGDYVPEDKPNNPTQNITINNVKVVQVLSKFEDELFNTLANE